MSLSLFRELKELQGVKPLGSYCFVCLVYIVEEVYLSLLPDYIVLSSLHRKDILSREKAIYNIYIPPNFLEIC